MRLTLGALLVLWIPLISWSAPVNPPQDPVRCLKHLSLYFIENKGQMDEEVAYYVPGTDKTLFFTKDSVTFSLQGDDARWSVKMDFVDPDPRVVPRGEDRQTACFNYFKGSPEEWETGVSTYARLVYEDLWPGIDLVYAAASGRLKYAFIVEPGANPEMIRFTYRGADEVGVNGQGGLEVTTPLGTIEDGRPRAFQVVDGEEVGVSMRYELEGKSADGAFSCGFEVGPYDAGVPLVLDPLVYIYCGYVGGLQQDWGYGIAVDATGHTYLTGRTESPEWSFPVQVGPCLHYQGGFYGDAFVAKVSPDGDHLVYCGYIGGSDEDWGFGLALDGDDRLYVVGRTNSTEASFPARVGPDLTFNGGLFDAFVARIMADGTDLEYCGYIGGVGEDRGGSIAVDQEGNAFLVGFTGSNQASFPVKVGPDLTYNGFEYDGFVAKVKADGSSLDYCGYIGGELRDYCYDIVLDPEGNAYVVGRSNSSEATFPVKIGPDLTFNGGFFDAFVARVRADGTDLDFCGYIGGDGHDYGYGIDRDASGNLYVAGSSNSTTSSFPVKVGPDLTQNGDMDGFVAKVEPDGTDLVFCGYIGGDAWDDCFAVAADAAGNVSAIGRTLSTETTFPVVLGPDLTQNGYYDGYLAQVKHDGTGLVYCGFIGGSSEDICGDMVMDSAGSVHVVGYTYCNESQFPVAVGPDLSHNGSGDVFVLKMNFALAAGGREISASLGGTVDFSLFAGAANGMRSYFLLGSVSGTTPGFPLPGGPVLPLNWDAFTGLTYALANTPALKNSNGVLNGFGTGSAVLDTLGGLPPNAVGVTMHFAYLLYAPFDFVSDPVAVVIVP